MLLNPPTEFFFEIYAVILFILLCLLKEFLEQMFEVFELRGVKDDQTLKESVASRYFQIDQKPRDGMTDVGYFQIRRYRRIVRVPAHHNRVLFLGIGECVV